jgi:hypothetical protein
MKELTQSERYYLANRADNLKEIKFLLTPYISTRLYVYFNHRDPGKRKKTFYANEHRCTYSQCVKGMVPSIILNKMAGYQALINMVEQTIKGKYISAKLYLRPPGSQQFEILCREYFKGELILQNDPPFTGDECQVLYYYTKDGRLIITEKDPALEDFTIKI